MFEPEKIRIGVGAFIQDKEKRVLLEKRRDCGLWCLPGGMLDPGELLKEVAIREVEEETGLKILVAGLVGIYSDFESRRLTYSDSGTFRLIDVVVRAKIIGGVLRVSPESFEVAFFAKENLPQILPRAMAPIQDALQGLEGVIA